MEIFSREHSEELQSYFDNLKPEQKAKILNKISFNHKINKYLQNLSETTFDSFSKEEKEDFSKIKYDILIEKIKTSSLEAKDLKKEIDFNEDFLKRNSFSSKAYEFFNIDLNNLQEAYNKHGKTGAIKDCIKHLAEYYNYSPNPEEYYEHLYGPDKEKELFNKLTQQELLRSIEQNILLKRNYVEIPISTLSKLESLGAYSHRFIQEYIEEIPFYDQEQKENTHIEKIEKGNKLLKELNKCSSKVQQQTFNIMSEHLMKRQSSSFYWTMDSLNESHKIFSNFKMVLSKEDNLKHIISDQKNKVSFCNQEKKDNWIELPDRKYTNQAEYEYSNLNNICENCQNNLNLKKTYLSRRQNIFNNKEKQEIQEQAKKVLSEEIKKNNPDWFHMQKELNKKTDKIKREKLDLLAQGLNNKTLASVFLNIPINPVISKVINDQYSRVKENDIIVHLDEDEYLPDYQDLKENDFIYKTVLPSKHILVKDYKEEEQKRLKKYLEIALKKSKKITPKVVN